MIQKFGKTLDITECVHKASSNENNKARDRQIHEPFILKSGSGLLFHTATA